MAYPVKVGKREQLNYGRIREVARFQTLFPVQLDSYEWFLEKGLREVFKRHFADQRFYRQFVSRIRVLYFRRALIHCKNSAKGGTSPIRPR